MLEVKEYPQNDCSNAGVWSSFTYFCSVNKLVLAEMESWSLSGSFNILCKKLPSKLS